MRRILKEKYKAFSLVEMLITISIMGVIMLISSSVLTTLIRVSIVGSDKVRARNESEFVLELLRRTVRNSDPSNVFVFNSLEERTFDPVYQEIEDDIPVREEGLYVVPLSEGDKGNEIHFRPYGYRDWICLGFFRAEPTIEGEEGRGYILWTSKEELAGEHKSCFALTGPESYLMVLNSEYINIKDFDIYYTLSADGNYIIRFDILSEPVNWYMGPGSPVRREVFRQGTVSTEGVTW